jgi:hypothetical protein
MWSCLRTSRRVLADAYYGNPDRNAFTHGVAMMRAFGCTDSLIQQIAHFNHQERTEVEGCERSGVSEERREAALHQSLNYINVNLMIYMCIS